tara:strand:- start:5748 stop:6833 length:1086 start_codon:yes stop_codon:yes gene_type:complete
MIKTYEAIFDAAKKNVYSISLVDDPAMESKFIALKKQEKQIKLAEVDKLERTLLGVVLIPNKPIYRNQNGEEFYITFPKETIQASAHNFLKSGFQLNSKLEHEHPIVGISFVESWIVKDPKNDTANAYGLDKDDIIEGSWIVKMKCENDDIYKKALSGEINGFSIDGLFNLKEVNLKSNIKMAEETKSFKDQVNEVLVGLGIVKEVKLGSVQSGELTIQYDGEMLEVGTVVFVTEGEERIALPDGDYPTDMGMLVVVEGVVTAVNVEEAPLEEELSTPSAPSTEEITQAIKSLLIKYSEDVDAKFETINKDLVEFKKENETLKAEVVTLSNQPAAKSVKTEIKQVELTKKGRILQSIRNNK